jgi:hypothetical protein
MMSPEQPRQDEPPPADDDAERFRSAGVGHEQRFGQYSIDNKIGAGTMGVVYRAHHAMLSRPAVVKLIDPSKTNDQAIARFEREVQVTSQLNHPNTIAIYDYGRTAQGAFYYVMEYRQLALQHHPDRGGKLDKFVELQTAYERAKEYVAFRTDKRKWIAARAERYGQAQHAADVLEALGAEVDLGAADWLKRSFGDFADLASSIKEIRCGKCSDADAMIHAMVQEKSVLGNLNLLDLSGCRVSDTALLNLRHFPGLVELDLRGTPAGNTVLELIKDLPNLTRLELADTKVGMLTRWRIRRLLADRLKNRPVFISERA